MSTKRSFKGCIGAWIDSEPHPSGANYASPNSNFNSMKLNEVYKSLDYLNIAWYHIDESNPAEPVIATDNPGLHKIITDARAQNPDIVIFATLAYNNTLLNQLRALATDPTLLNRFAANTSSYLTSNNMNGFDIDWESPISELNKTESTAIFNALGTAFGDTQYLSISPAVPYGLDGNAVNNNCSVVNLQTYSGFTNPSDFVKIGIDPSLIGFGAKFESRSQYDPSPYQDALSAATEYKAGFSSGGTHYDYSTICNWRLDSGNWSFEQGQQLLLKQYIDDAPYTVPFDDGTIIRAQTTRTLMHTVDIRSGEVVDAIQTKNQSSDGSYIVEMLQHGGDSGTVQPTITLGSSGLDSFSYVTGYWYGQNVVAQITINGTSYPSSVSSSVSNTSSHTVNAPSGQSIVAFKGETLKVLLAGGGTTWVLSEIDAVFG
jgi:hypothetical protein